jgi:mono/diheme cytochrome c family protein
MVHLLGLCLHLAAIAMARGSGPSPSPPISGDHPGKRVYDNACASCHADNGLGVTGVYPPLAGSPWLEMEPVPLIRMQLHGLQGPIVVNGESYDSAMPPNAETMTDQEVADVLNFVRGTWGKPGLPPVDAALVGRERALHADREVAWTIAELIGPPVAAAAPARPANVAPLPAPPAGPMPVVAIPPLVPRWGVHGIFLLPLIVFLAVCLCLRDH